MYILAIMTSQVTFIYIVLYTILVTILIVSKQLYSNKQENIDQ